MRKRKRDNWPVVVYKYRAYIDPAELPEWVWQHSRTQNKVWNRLVEHLRVQLDKWEKLKEYKPDKKSDSWDALQKVFWETFWNECVTICDESTLGWEARDDIMNRFRTTVQEAFKNKERGMPRFRSGVQRVRMVHRYTGGGLPVENLFGSRAWRFSILQSPPDGAYDDNAHCNRRKRIVPARFGIDGEIFNFRLRLHRQMPDGAIVKNMAFLGEYRYHPDPAQRWIWHVAFWLEIPPMPEVSAPEHPRVIGLDLGWRKFYDYIRIGYGVDTDGNKFELCYPLDTSNYRTRRDKGLPQTWADKAALDTEIAKAVDDVKEEIKPLLAICKLSAEIKRSVASMVKMRQGGLVRLMYSLSDLKEEGGEYWSEEIAQVVSILAAWHEQNNSLRFRVDRLARRLTNRRRWLYGNIAAWLSKSYDIIIWEGSLDIKAMAEDVDKEHALKAADHWRQIVAIGELRSAIKNACDRKPVQLIAGKTAGTTNKCSLCDGMIEVSPKLKLVCENGHILDTDENAARNLLRQGGSRSQEGDTAAIIEKAAIPAELSGVAVPVHSV